MEEILEKIPAYLTILFTICGGVTTALVGGLAIWTFRDIRARSRDVLAQILATLLVLVLPVVGLIVYLIHLITLFPSVAFPVVTEESLKRLVITGLSVELIYIFILLCKKY